MSLPYTLSNGAGNYPDATKFNANYNYLEVLARRNRIINGNFFINQRLATLVADDVYCLDRWYVLTETGNVTVAKMTDQENGTPANIKLTQPDGTPKRIGLAQIIESDNVRDLKSTAVQLTGRIKCSVSQAIRYAVVGFGSTADTVTSDIVNTWSSSTYTASNFFIASTNICGIGSTTPSAATWTNFTLSATLGTETNAIVFVWTEGTLAQNGTLEIGRMSLRRGSEMVSGESYATDIASELLSCQRYYEKSYSQGTAPGTASTTAGSVYFRANGTNHLEGVSFKVTKRVAPTVTLYNANSGASGTWRDYSGSADRTATATYIGDAGMHVALTSSVDGNACGGHFVADAEL